MSSMNGGDQAMRFWISADVTRRTSCGVGCMLRGGEEGTSGNRN